MTQEQIGELMRQATLDLPAADLAPAALVRARRVRRRRRAAGTVAVVAAVAAAIAIGVVLPRGGDPVSHHPAPASPIPLRDFTAPLLSPSIIQPALDPARIPSLPTSLGLPDLVPSHASTTLPGRAVLVTKSDLGPQNLLYALDTEHGWHRLTVQVPVHAGSPPYLDVESLSPDGTKVALRDGAAAYLVDLGSGATRRLDAAKVAYLRWQGDSRHLLVEDDYGNAKVIDTRTGALQLLTDRVGTSCCGFVATYDGSTLIRSTELAHGATALEEATGARVTLRARTIAADSYSIEHLAVDKRRLAATASPYFAAAKRPHGDGTGLLVLSRRTYAGAAFLPVKAGEGLEYLTGSALVPRGWVGDLLLFSIAPQTDHGGTITMPTQDYLTWNLRTGAIARVGSVPHAWRESSWATGLL